MRRSPACWEKFPKYCVNLFSAPLVNISNTPSSSSLFTDAAAVVLSSSDKLVSRDFWVLRVQLILKEILWFQPIDCSSHWYVKTIRWCSWRSYWLRMFRRTEDIWRQSAPHFALCTVHQAPCTTLCTVHSAPYTVHYPPCTVHCALCIVHCTLCT